MSLAHKRPRHGLTTDAALVDAEKVEDKALCSDVDDVESLAEDADVVPSSELWGFLGDSLTAIRGFSGLRSKNRLNP